MNKMRAIALPYAEFGWPVFPVHTPTGDTTRPCSCRRATCPQLGNHPCHKNTCKDRRQHPCHQAACNSAGKHPRTKNGAHDASTDEAKIRRWWEAWEDANIGVATGRESGFFALDVDPPKGGAESLSSLEAKHGNALLPKAYTESHKSLACADTLDYKTVPTSDDDGVFNACALADGRRR